MAKLLNTTFLVTQSAPATPSSDFGTLFASSSKLFFKNSSGTTYDLTTAGGGGGYVNILTYTASGNYTPTPGVQYIKVICAGAGGGGGSGRVAGAGTTTPGGQGGSGGNINIAYFSSSALLGNTYSVNIGVGGPGAARRTSNGLLNGLTGTTGLSSSFGTGSGASFVRLLSALGGPGGLGAGQAGGATGNTVPTIAQVPNPYPPFYYSGVNGSIDTAGPTNANNAFNGSRFLAGGGTGGRIFGDNTPTAGGSGSAIFSYNTLIPSGSPSAAASGLPGDNGAAVIDIAQLLFYSGSNITTGIKVGTGGHGGGSGNRGVTPLVSAGNGGSGSLAAGGGGGGGAAFGLNTVFSGAGGLGGDGFVIIFEYI